MFFSENQLKAFSKPLSDTDKLKCEHAILAVKNSLKKGGFIDIDKDNNSFSQIMKKDNQKIKILLQGSFANNTNIKSESDVDIAVVIYEPFKVSYRTDGNHPQNNNTFGLVDVPSVAETFKDDIYKHLKSYFNNPVYRHNKSIKISENTYRSDIDVVPAMRYRNYKYNYNDDPNNYLRGILVKPDTGVDVINYPELHISESRNKNVNTNHSYKKQVRILKNMKELMKSEGYSSARNVSSFGLESLLWNIPDDCYKNYFTLKFIFDDIVMYLNDNTNKIFNDFKEANGVKNLCKSQDEANDYIKFVKDLSNFYNYDFGV